MLPGRLFRYQGQRPHPNGLGRLGPDQVVSLANIAGINITGILRQPGAGGPPRRPRYSANEHPVKTKSWGALR